MTGIDEKTLEYLNAIEKSLDMLCAYGEKSEVVEAMRYSLLGAGKRVRGILTLAACELVSGDYKAAVPAASAIEMVHCYSLIHDDLPAMDNDDLRRGKPSCHVQFGENIAILAGDALLTLAFNALTGLESCESVRECVAVLSKAAGHKGMVLGQEMDIKSEGKTLTATQLTRIHSCKTGALINASVKMGAIAGGATQSQNNALLEYSELIGLAFQIVDDILDQTSDEKELGKTTSDKERGKATGTSVHGIEKARSIAAGLTVNAISALDREFDDTAYLTALANKLLKRTK